MLAPSLTQIKAGQVSADRLRPMFDEIAQGLMLNYEGIWFEDDRKQPPLDDDSDDWDFDDEA